MKLSTALFISLLLPGTLLAEIRLTDDMGNDVLLEQPAGRIVTLIPHATELLFDIGAGDRVVATVEYSNYPEAARQIDRVGNYNTLNTEAIIALEPDLLIAFTDAPNLGDVSRLKELGLTVYHSDPQSFTDIAATLRDFGRMTGMETSAEKTASRFEGKIESLRSTYSEEATLSVFYEVWHDPIFTLNGESFISDIIELCAGENVFADLPALSPQVSLEAIFEKDPQVIVTSPPAENSESHWYKWPQLQAVENDALVFIDPDDMHRPTPSLLTGATQLCEELDRLRAEVY